MKNILVAVAICAAIAAGCAHQACHRPHRCAAPCGGEDRPWVNPNATPLVSEFGLNDAAPMKTGVGAPLAPRVSAKSGPYSITADQLTTTSYRHKDGRVESTGCAECHTQAGKHCSGCNKIPPSVEYCTQCH